MFSARNGQLHSKRPTLNAQCLTQKLDRPLRPTMLQVCGCAAIINIELATGRVRPLADKGLLDPPI
jgi:hypothetical protein